MTGKEVVVTTVELAGQLVMVEAQLELKSASLTANQGWSLIPNHSDLRGQEQS